MGAAVAAYIAAFSAWSSRNHDGLGTFGFDLGIFDQGVWLLSRFHEPFVTVRGIHLFGDHTSFILLALVPFYWIAPSPKILLVSQSIALGIAAIPLYQLGRHQLGSGWLALAGGLAYLAHPATGWANMEQFHPDAFQPPLILLALYLMTQERWRWFTATVVVLLLIKEDVPLLVFALGIYVAIRHHRRVGLLTAALAVGWMSFNLLLILPHFNGVGTLYASRVPFGGPWGLVTTIATDPGSVVSQALGPDKPWYLWQLFAPFALVPLLGLPVVLIAAGPLGLNLLTDWWYAYHIEYHYHTLIVPVLAAATVYGLALIKQDRWRQIVAGLVVTSALSSAYFWGPAPWSRHPAPIGDPGRAEVASVRQAMALIPEEARVSAFFSYVPHLAHRTHIYEFTNPWHAANWFDGRYEGTELPEASLVEFIILPSNPAFLGDEANALLDELRPNFSTLVEDEFVLLLQRSTR